MSVSARNTRGCSRRSRPAAEPLDLRDRGAAAQERRHGGIPGIVDRSFGNPPADRANFGVGKAAMDEAEFQRKKAEMEPWYWWGIQTFFKCPWDENPANCDIGLVGVPHSS